MKLKTRTNQPVYYKLPVSSNIQSLSDDLLNSLRVGDVVQKKTGNQKHCYVVTYKEEKKGICLTYIDASSVETISYDYTGGHWVYNSKDVTSLENIAHTTGANFTGAITSPSIIEDMTGYSLISLPASDTHKTVNNIYVGVCKNGNKLTFVVFGSITILDSDANMHNNYVFDIPSEVAAKLYPYDIGGGLYLDNRTIQATQKSNWERKTLSLDVVKNGNHVGIDILAGLDKLTANQETYFRVEQTFLLSENLVPSGE